MESDEPRDENCMDYSDQELSDQYYTKKFCKVNKEDRQDDDKLRRQVGVSVSLCRILGLIGCRLRLAVKDPVHQKVSISSHYAEILFNFPLRVLEHVLMLETYTQESVPSLHKISRSRSLAKRERSTKRVKRRLAFREETRHQHNPSPKEGNTALPRGRKFAKESYIIISYYLDGYFNLEKEDQKGCKNLLDDGKTTLDSMTDIDPLDLAFDLSLSALLGENVYNFGELLAHPIVKSPLGTKEKIEKRSKFIMDVSNNHGSTHKRRYSSVQGSPSSVVDVYFSSDNSNNSWAFASSVASSPEPPFKKNRAQKQQMRLTLLFSDINLPKYGDAQIFATGFCRATGIHRSHPIYTAGVYALIEHHTVFNAFPRDHQLQGAGVVVEGDGEEEGLELHKYEDVGWDVPGGFPRGIGRGRDRSFRGRGRENYNNAPFMDNQQEVGGYNQESPRGRGGRNFRGQGWGGYNNDSCVDNQQEAGVVDAIVVVVADKQVAVVQAVREISVLAGEFLPSRACMTLASLKSTEVVSLITTAVEHLVTGEMMQMSTSAEQSRRSWIDVIVFRCGLTLRFWGWLPNFCLSLVTWTRSFETSDLTLEPKVFDSTAVFVSTTRGASEASTFLCKLCQICSRLLNQGKQKMLKRYSINFFAVVHIDINVGSKQVGVSRKETLALPLALAYLGLFRSNPFFSSCCNRVDGCLLKRDPNTLLCSRKGVLTAVKQNQTLPVAAERGLLLFKQKPNTPDAAERAFILSLLPDSVKRVLEEGIDGDFTISRDNMIFEGSVYKATKLKPLMWLPEINELAPLTLVEFGYLLKKNKLGENDNLIDAVNPDSRKEISVVGDANMRMLKHGEKRLFQM
ncbi:proteasome component domain-containing protein [Tanacetum coccineum]|uniref:Proteasome component domain-containing protein n=1 Tax=Tanacetum coccineum TaxID=301880 RepID=A0ABQ5ID02_9ASTR